MHSSAVQSWLRYSVGLFISIHDSLLANLPFDPYDVWFPKG